MKIKNINPQHDDLRVAALAGQVVKYDAEVDVPAEVAAVLLVQVDTWEPADDEAAELLTVALPAHLEQLDAASSATVVTEPVTGPAADPDPAEGEQDPDPAAAEAAAKAEAKKAAAAAKAAEKAAANQNQGA